MTFRYRRLDADGDMTYGRGRLNFLVDTPETVAQSVLTRLNLWQGEWFLNLAEGTPWMQRVLGKPRAPGSPDAAIRARILGTPYVVRMTDYASQINPAARTLTISAKIFTAFGQVLSVNEAPGIAVTPSGAVVFRFSPAG